MMLQKRRSRCYLIMFEVVVNSNPLLSSKSQFQKYYPLEQVLKARAVHDVLGLLECSPTSDGAAAVVLVSERWLNQHPNLRAQAVEILGVSNLVLPSKFRTRIRLKSFSSNV